MWHIIPIGGDAISQMSEVYRYFDENESIRALNGRYLFIDSDPNVLDESLSGIPDSYILGLRKQRDATDSPQSWMTVDEAFENEFDALRDWFYTHFMVNSQSEKVNGILLMANLGGGTGSKGLIKLLDFFERWRNTSGMGDIANYLDPERIPRYALIIFPKTKKVGMSLQLKNNAKQAYKTLKNLRETGILSGLLYFDRDTIGLVEDEFNHRFTAIMTNLIIHERRIVEEGLLSACSAVSHNRFDVNWGIGKKIKILNYKDDGKNFTLDNGLFKIRRMIDLAEYKGAGRKRGLTLRPFISVYPQKVNYVSGKIALDREALENNYGNGVKINEIQFLKSIYHNVIDVINFIAGPRDYDPYEELLLKGSEFRPERRTEVSLKYQLSPVKQKEIRSNLTKGVYLKDGVYEQSAKKIEENDLYVKPMFDLKHMTPAFEYLRIRERGTEYLLTLKLKELFGETRLRRNKYEIGVSDPNELTQILKLLGYETDIAGTATLIKKSREIVYLGVVGDSKDGKTYTEFILNFDYIENLGSFIEIQCFVQEAEHKSFEALSEALATKILLIPEEGKQPRSYLELMKEKISTL